MRAEIVGDRPPTAEDPFVDQAAFPDGKNEDAKALILFSPRNDICVARLSQKDVVLEG